MSANTLFLRLEGPLQAWGDQQSKFVIRRTAEAPTKSGVIGMLCAALGISRAEAAASVPDRRTQFSGDLRAPTGIADRRYNWLARLAALRMGVRIDRPGVRWWDYHTVGARTMMRTADGGIKPGAMLTRREYLCDASFLVALQGHEPELIAQLEEKVKAPQWTLYLGRKCCPPSRPLWDPKHTSGDFPDLLSALKSVPWRPRLDSRLRGNDRGEGGNDDPGDGPPQLLECLLDWHATLKQPEAPDDALVWYDVPISFDPPAHEARFVVRKQIRVIPRDDVIPAQAGIQGPERNYVLTGEPTQHPTPAPRRPRADYTNSEYKNQRQKRLNDDHRLCVFCKAPATTVQHVTYRHAGGDERLDELRSLCRLCHDAVTMIEYGLGMGLDRINPEDPQWRDRIMQKRDEIIAFRSLETRRRRLTGEFASEVE